MGERKPPLDLKAAPLLSAVSSYLRYYAEGSGHTARAKRLDLQHFLDFLVLQRGCAKAANLKIADWDHSSVQLFLDYSLARGESPATVARRLATLKHLGRTMSEQLPGFINPAREVRAPKIKIGMPKSISRPEINKVRKKAEARLSQRKSFNRLRNETLFNFLLDTGLRADEVRTLKLGQLDESLTWIKNVRTKGKRYRNVYITSAIRKDLKHYLAERKAKLEKLLPKYTKSQDRALPLFISSYNAVPENPESFFMGAKSIWRAINELSTDTHLHPHLLRHSYAMDLLESSNDIRLVAQALGHSDVRITMRYTERSDAQVAAALEKSRKNNPRPKVSEDP
ncbi:MAG: tyrosine-type recombinase/integrase [Deltaproteobacteria bacterium]|nr:tyrosine-type recombinase/integrase [Deltaproteobacteria bacterium]